MNKNEIVIECDEEYKPLFLSKTEGEWDLIMKKVKESGRKDLSFFIRSEIRKLIAAYSECPDCISKAKGEKKLKRPYIPIEYYKKLEKIADKMQIPVSAVVDNLIILPLLRGKEPVV